MTILLPSETISRKKKEDPRYAVAQALMTPQTARIEHPLEGLANMARMAAGTYKQRKLDREYENKANAADAQLMGAMDAYSRSQQGGQTQLKSGEKINWNKATPDEAQAALTSNLLSNPDTAGIGAQIQLDDMAAKKDLAATIAREQALFPMELEKARALAGIRASAAGADVGGSTGVLLNRLVEAGQATDPNFGLIDALEMLKGGAGARGRLQADLELGRDANYETQTGKNLSDMEYKPKIENLTSQESVVGKETGEARAKLKAMESQYPRLVQVTEELSALGKTATYNTVGRARDAAARELGLPVPDSAVARAEYISKVDNEVLPLLRQTFGSQFTKAEGDSLKFTLGDPNKSPEEKDAVLRSFISQKAAEVNALQRQTGQPETSMVTPVIPPVDINAPVGKLPPNPGPPPAPVGKPQISTDAEYDALPSGTRFIDPEGNERVKP